MRPFQALVIVLAAGLLFTPMLRSEDSTKVLLETPPVEESIRQQISKMSLEEKVGQLFFVGFDGTQLTMSLREHLLTLRPGGIIFFRRNIRSAEQASRLTRDIRDLFLDAGYVPPFLAVDQEGGSVTRIQRNPPAPSALAMGRAKNPELVKSLGHHTGILLKQLGFNMNLAPVLDLADPAKPSFIASRSFAGDPSAVADSAFAFMDGQDGHGIITTFKHFPGNGGTVSDPHLASAQSNQAVDQVLKENLVPYSQIGKKGRLPAIMVAHVAYPAIDPSGQPATFSELLVRDLLRNKLKLESVVITDDLQMAGAKSLKTPGERAQKAVEAGVDMTMFSWSVDAQKRAHKQLFTAAMNGKVTEARIDESLRRILDLKFRYGLFQKTERPTKALLAKTLSDPDYEKAVDLLMRNIFKVSLPAGLKRFDPPDATNPVLVFSYSEGFFNGLTSEIHSTVRLPTQTPDLAEHMGRFPSSTAIFYVSGPQSARAAMQMAPMYRARSILVNASIPGMISARSSFRAVIDISSHYPRVGRWLGLSMFKKPEELNGNQVRQPARSSD